MLRREVVADGEAERGDPAGGVEPPPAPRERGRGHRGAGVADAGEDGDEDLVGEGAEQVGVVARAGPVAAAGPLGVGIAVVAAGLHRRDGVAGQAIRSAVSLGFFGVGL